MAEIKNFFGIIDCVLKKGPYPEDEVIQKQTVQWMCNNMLSCDEQLAPLAATLSSLKMSNKEYFDILYFGIPKTNKFIRYAAQKAKADQLNKDVSIHFGVSLEMAKRYIKLLPASEIKYITELYEEKGLKKGKK